MAQTKRKRRSKHRGTAGGTVIARGRTGRKPTSEELKDRDKGKPTSAQKRAARYMKPPTWRNSFQRAGLVTGVFIVLVLLVLRGKPGPTIILVPFVLIMYTVMGYYTDLWLHRRWLRRQESGGGR